MRQRRELHVAGEHTTCRRLDSANDSEVQTTADGSKPESVEEPRACINGLIMPLYALEHWPY